MRITIVILLITAFFTSEAQTHAEEHYEYDRLYKMMEGYYNRGLYHKSALYPDSLKGNRYVNGSSNYFFARVHALGNEFDRTLFYLEKAVKQGITKTQIERMYDLDGFRESNLNIIYNLNYDKWHQEYLDSDSETVLDSVYIKEVQRINLTYKNDLKLRKIEGKDDMWIKDSTNYYYTRKRLDSAIFYGIIDLTIERGFPTKRTIGKEYYRYSRNLRYNMPEDFDENCGDWKKIKRMIFVEIEKGTIYPFYYAAIEDYMRYRKRRPQWYGTMNYIYKSSIDYTNGVQFENPEELNVRRRSVGLCSIQLELWSQARELPKSLKEVKFK